MAVKTSQNMRSGLAALGYVVKSTASQDPTAAPTVTSGTGVPATTEPNGSIFLRTDGTTADTAIYARISGSWVAMKGAT
jgi:hypothetical protein